MVAAAFRPATSTTATSSGSTSTSTATTTVRYVLANHLGGSSVIVSSSGTIVEALDYMPYGSARLDETTGPYVGEKRKFIGEMYDSASQLSYLNARYYNGSNGRFLSQDPIFQLVGDQAFAQTFQGNWRYTK